MLSQTRCSVSDKCKTESIYCKSYCPEGDMFSPLWKRKVQVGLKCFYCLSLVDPIVSISLCKTYSLSTSCLWPYINLDLDFPDYIVNIFCFVIKNIHSLWYYSCLKHVSYVLKFSTYCKVCSYLLLLVRAKVIITMLPSNRTYSMNVQYVKHIQPLYLQASDVFLMLNHCHINMYI